MFKAVLFWESGDIEDIPIFGTELESRTRAIQWTTSQHEAGAMTLECNSDGTETELERIGNTAAIASGWAEMSEAEA